MISRQLSSSSPPDRHWMVRTAVVALGLLSNGCSEEDPIRGRVLLNGRPLTTGMVVMIPVSNLVSTRGFGTIDGRGRFEIMASQASNVMQPGKYNIYIRPPTVASSRKGVKDVAASFSVPEKYLDWEAPSLQLDYAGEPMRVEINLN